MRILRTAQPPTEDQALVRRIVAGDEEAFRGFFDQHVRGLYRFVMARVDNNPEATQEIVQSTLVKAVESFGAFRGDGALSSWLYGICRFEIQAYYRSRTRARREEPYDAPRDDGRPSADAWISDDDGPDVDLGRKETSGQVHEALDRLPRHYGDALEWKYLDGLKVKQIAQRLDMAPKAAESLLTRAREAFRREFERLRSRVPSQWRGELRISGR